MKNKEKRFLITTALEGTWLRDQPVIFLGEWCRLYSRKDIWSGMNAEVTPYHWRESEKLCLDYEYVNSLYESILVELAESLNTMHGVDYSNKYWRILIGPWIANLIHVLYDRWLSITTVISLYDITGTIILESNIKSLVTNDLKEFDELIKTDEWNHNIYAEIINSLDICQPLIKKNYKEHQKISEKENRSSIKTYISKLYLFFSKCLSRNQDVFFLGTYISKLELALLQLKLGQFPQFWSPIVPVIVNYDKEFRNFEIKHQAKNEFEKILLKLIPKHIPRVYLEGYEKLSDQVANSPWPKSPKLIYTANALWAHPVTMAYAAEKVENGTPLVYGQHGGGYGVSKFSFSEEHEIKIAKRYLTWGWDSKYQSSVIPIGIEKIRKMKRKKINEYNTLLMVTLNASRYSFRLGGETNRNFLDYFEDYFSFTSLLQADVKNNMVVRLNNWDKGWAQPLRWKDKFPDVKLELEDRDIFKLMSESRIVVHTYNSTGILESLAMGIPCILFYDLKNIPLRDSAIPYFEELRQVGILHDNPISAAAHIDNVWNNVDLWWTSDKVQKAVLNFNKRYCHNVDSISSRIKSILKEIIKE